MILTIKQFIKLFKDTALVLRPKSLKDFPNGVISYTKITYNNSLNRLSLTKKKMRNLVKTNLDLGIHHFYKGNINDAHFRFKLLQICTSDIRALIYYNIGRCYVAENKNKKAKKFFMQALNSKKNFQEVYYYLAKIDDSCEIDNIPILILRERFNYMSSYYVEEYINQYKAHKIAFNEIISYFHNRINIIDILDVGCGTGVCAHFLKINHIGNQIIGVDISNDMLDIARNCYAHDKAVYDQLFNMEITEYLNSYDNKEKFDLILSIDSSCYQRSLYESFAMYKNTLKVGGLIICLLREAKSHDVEFVNELDLFRFTQDYMLKLSSELGMEPIRVIKCQLYNNVDGLLCMFKKVD